MRLTSSIFSTRYPFINRQVTETRTSAELASEVVAQAQSLGGRFTEEEASCLVVLVDTLFPAGNDHRVELWRELLMAGLDPNARITRATPGEGWAAAVEPAYFTAQTAAEIEPFIAHGADPQAKADMGNHRAGPVFLDVLRSRRSGAMFTAGRYSSDLLPRVEGWYEAVYGPRTPTAMAHAPSMMGMPPGLLAGRPPARYEVPQPGRQPGEALLQPARLRMRPGR